MNDFALKPTPSSPEDFGRYLLRTARVSASQLMRARSQASQLNCNLVDVLQAEGILSAESVSEATAAYLCIALVDLEEALPDASLAALFDPAIMLRYRVLPWAQSGGKTLIAAANTDDFSAFLAQVKGSRSQYEMVVARPTQIIDFLMTTHRDFLVNRASARVPARESCRTWEKHTSKRRLVVTLIVLAALLTVTVLYPQIVFAAFAFWATATLLISALVRISAHIAEMSSPPDDMPPLVCRTNFPKSPF